MGFFNHWIYKKKKLNLLTSKEEKYNFENSSNKQKKKLVAQKRENKFTKIRLCDKDRDMAFM